MKPFGIFKDKTHDNKDDLILNTYLVKIKGKPNADSEIEKLFWVDRNFKHKEVKTSIPMQKYIIPKLVELNLIE